MAIGGFGGGLLAALSGIGQGLQQAEQQRRQKAFTDYYLQQLRDKDALAQGESNLYNNLPQALAGIDGTGGMPTLSQPPMPGQSSTPRQPFSPTPTGSGMQSGMSDPRGLIPYIQQTAQKYGIDPAVAVRVASSEGLGNPIGDGGTSFGAMQLHTGGGMGDEFRRDTGLDPADLANERATIDYGLSRARQTGWAPWHGAARVGIGPRQGIGTAPAGDVGVTDGPDVAPTAPAARPGSGSSGGPAMPASAGDSAPSGPAAAPEPQYTKMAQNLMAQQPPQLYGGLGIEGAKRLVDRSVPPGAPPEVRAKLMDSLSKYFAPIDARRWEEYKLQQQRQWQLQGEERGEQRTIRGEERGEVRQIERERRQLQERRQDASSSEERARGRFVFEEEYKAAHPPPKQYEPKLFQDKEGNQFWVAPGQAIPKGTKEVRTEAVGTLLEKKDGSIIRLRPDGTVQQIEGAEGAHKLGTKGDLPAPQPETVAILKDMLKSGLNPPSYMARGPQGQANLGAAMSEMGKEGVRGGDIALARADVRANQNSLSGLTKVYDQTKAFEGLAEKNLDAAVAQAEKTVPTDFGPFLNRWIMSGETQFGNEDVPAYTMLVVSSANELARVLSASTGAAAMTDSARREAAEVLSPYFSAGQFKAAAGVAKQEMRRRIQELESGIGEIRGRAQTPGVTTGGAAPPTAPRTIEQKQQGEATPAPSQDAATPAAAGRPIEPWMKSMPDGTFTAPDGTRLIKRGDQLFPAQ